MPGNKTDPVGARIKRWAGWGSAISTGIVAVVAPLWVLVADMRSDIRDAKSGTEASYETLAPIVAENQEFLRDGIKMLGTRVHEIRQSRSKLKDRLITLEQRMTRCETYIEVMSRGRYRPAREPLEASTDEVLMSTKAEEPPEVVQQVTQKPQRPVPKSLRKAKDYQKKREKLECSADDPLCGL